MLSLHSPSSQESTQLLPIYSIPCECYKLVTIYSFPVNAIQCLSRDICVREGCALSNSTTFPPLRLGPLFFIYPSLAPSGLSLTSTSEIMSVSDGLNILLMSIVFWVFYPGAPDCAASAPNPSRPRP